MDEGTGQTLPEEKTDQIETEESSKMNIIIGGTTFAVTLADNSSAEALAGMVREGPLTPWEVSASALSFPTHPF